MATVHCHNHTEAKNDGPFGVLAYLSASNVFLGIVGDVMGRGVPGSATHIIVDAAATIPSANVVPLEWADQLASAVAKRVEAKLQGDPACVTFCAVAVTPEAVGICTAGDIRVHMIKDDTRYVTRDHVLGNEPPNWVREKYGDISVRDHAIMLTRTIGMCSLPPGRETWSVTPPFTILVCSAEYHRYRSPDAYVGELLEQATQERPTLNDGILVRVDY